MLGLGFGVPREGRELGEERGTRGAPLIDAAAGVSGRGVRGGSSTAAWRASGRHCGDRGGEHFAKTPLSHFFFSVFIFLIENNSPFLFR